MKEDTRRVLIYLFVYSFIYSLIKSTGATLHLLYEQSCHSPTLCPHSPSVLLCSRVVQRVMSVVGVPTLISNVRGYVDTTIRCVDRL